MGRKLAVASLALASMLIGGALMMPSSPPGPSAGGIVVTPLKPTPPRPTTPAPTERIAAAVMSERELIRIRQRHPVPDAHKNRAGGERSHRRWRKSRSSGKP